MEIIIQKQPADLAQTVADWLLGYSAEVLQRQTRFTIALSGGSTPKLLFDLLAKPPYRDTIDWPRWHIFWGDERVVPFADERNNAGAAFAALLDRVPVPPAQVHVMPTDQEPAAAAAGYETLLHAYFEGQPATFDLVLLGLGDDGHTLSLFPGTEVVQEATAWVKAFYLESQAMYRLTLTAPVVNRAACVAFLVAGSGKAVVLQAVIQGPPGAYPAQRIQPANGRLLWFVDEAAAKLLSYSPKKES